MVLNSYETNIDTILVSIGVISSVTVFIQIGGILLPTIAGVSVYLFSVLVYESLAYLKGYAHLKVHNTLKSIFVFLVSSW